MGKLAIILMLFCSMVIATPLVVHGDAEGPQAVEDLIQNLSHKKEQVTKLHFYLHDIVAGSSPTAVRVAQANITSKSPTSFGATVMMDDPLTVGPEPNSTEVGRAQGIYALVSLEESGTLLMNFNFIFKSGSYNGSTLSVLGRNPVFHQYREMPIVGGSGVFRLARGIATAKTFMFDLTSGDTIVEYNVIVLHYSTSARISPTKSIINGSFALYFIISALLFSDFY